MTAIVDGILARLEFWRLPADAPVEEIVQVLTTAQVQRKPLDSSCVVSAGYDAESSVLELEFEGGRLHRYLGVPEFVYRQLRAATSKGRFYRAEVMGKYIGARFGRVDDEQAAA